MRTWVVDASNVVGARPDGWWRDRPGALARLVDRVAAWRSGHGERVLVVCDGRPTDRVPEGERGGVEVRYAGSSRRDAADDEVVRLLEDELAGAAAAVVVVTSDRALRDRAEALGAAVEGAGTFLRRLGAPET